jgi:hypothetical protein
MGFVYCIPSITGLYAPHIIVAFQIDIFSGRCMDNIVLRLEGLYGSFGNKLEL